MHLFIFLITFIHKGYGQLILPKLNAPSGLVPSIRSVKPKKFILRGPHANLDTEDTESHAYRQQRFLHVVKKLSDSKSTGQMFMDAFKHRDSQVLSYIMENPVFQKDLIHSLEKEDFKKLKGSLHDALISNSDNVLDLLLSTGRFTRDDIFSDIELHSLLPSTISSILNNPTAQDVLTDDDFEGVFLLLIKKRLMFLITLNEPARNKIINALSFRGEAFLTNLLRQEGVYKFPDIITILLRTHVLSRESIIKELERHVKENPFSTKTSSKNLFENVQIQNLLNDEDFVHFFFLAINRKDAGLLFIFKDNIEIKLRVLNGITSFSLRYMGAIEYMFSESVKHGFEDAIEIFGETNLISRKVVMGCLLPAFGFKPFANGNSYSIPKSILINPNFLSVLTKFDVETLFKETIERIHFKFILDMMSNPFIFDKLSTQSLQELKTKAQNKKITWWNSLFGQDKILESQRGEVVNKLDKWIAQRLKEESESFWM